MLRRRRVHVSCIVREIRPPLRNGASGSSLTSAHLPCRLMLLQLLRGRTRGGASVSRGASGSSLDSRSLICRVAQTFDFHCSREACRPHTGQRCLLLSRLDRPACIETCNSRNRAFGSCLASGNLPCCPLFDFRCCREAHRLVNFCPVAPNIVYLGLDLISKLEAVEIRDGALHRLMFLGFPRAAMPLFLERSISIVLERPADWLASVLSRLTSRASPSASFPSSGPFGNGALCKFAIIVCNFESQSELVHLGDGPRLDGIDQGAKNLPVMKPLETVWIQSTTSAFTPPSAASFSAILAAKSASRPAWSAVGMGLLGRV